APPRPAPRLQLGRRLRLRGGRVGAAAQEDRPRPRRRAPEAPPAGGELLGRDVAGAALRRRLRARLLAPFGAFLPLLRLLPELPLEPLDPLAHGGAELAAGLARPFAER